MNTLPVIDILIIVAYVIGMVGVGIYFSGKNATTDQFTRASGHIPGWALGLSLYATFLSSNTFLGVPGKAFGSNWNSFVFSLSMPFAAWIAARYFVPFYRKSGVISAYTHLEHRFGPWARTYAMVCFVLTQLARMGSIFFGIALTLQALTGIDMRTIMIVSGTCIILYTMMGGMEAVIWTEVAQAVIKTVGALVMLAIVVYEMKDGFSDIITIGSAAEKFSLGSYSLTDFTSSTFWVVFLYGFFINLNNFGIDQNYVQRYHAAKNEKEAARSIWLCVYWYLPVSLVFFFIGTALYAYFQQHPELLEAVKHQVAREKGVDATALMPADYGDKVLPYFMVTKVPHGLLGLIIAAILSAAMSTISSGMNSSATVFLKDIYQRYVDKDITPKRELRVLYIATAFMGVMAIITGIVMIGVKSILDMWWQLAGIFAGGMLGLFLLGIISRTTGNATAKLATAIGLLVILWMTFSYLLPDQYAAFRNPLHLNMVIVIGTLTIFLAGVLLSGIKKTQEHKHETTPEQKDYS
jgi:SSS family solute:Na+ symporter